MTLQPTDTESAALIAKLDARPMPGPLIVLAHVNIEHEQLAYERKENGNHSRYVLTMTHLVQGPHFLLEEADESWDAKSPYLSGDDPIIGQLPLPSGDDPLSRTAAAWLAARRDAERRARFDAA